MKKPQLNLIAALLTFGLGVFANSSLEDSNSVDKRLESLIRRVEAHNMKTRCKGTDTAEMWAEQCKKIEEYVKVNNRYPSNALKRVEDQNKSCAFNRLSVEQCEQEKEETIKEIEKFLVSENVSEEK